MPQALVWVVGGLAAVLVGAALALRWSRRQAAGEEGATAAARLDALENGIARVEQAVHGDLADSRREASAQAAQLRGEVQQALKQTGDSLVKSAGELSTAQRTQWEGLAGQVGELTRLNEQKLEAVRSAVETRLRLIQEENAGRLEQMRQTVDEKLQGTLEKRLGDSFKLVSERLELVHKGLGEMRDLATGVGDLKRVLTNVKTRGTWGEIQLGLLLEEILTPEQYARNVATKAGSNERVEFALRLPGRADTDGQTVWLPIDAKFPKEDYERLLAAQERADPEAAEESGGRLEEQIRRFARDIRDKYISPPGTTDFAVLFVPVEGLYAEVVRRPGLVEALQRDCRVVVAGPTTLAALLNSLQMGFRTLAIQKRSSEVWKLLGAVKTEFGRFGETLEAVQKKLHQASDSLEDASRRTRLIERRLKDVEELPAAESRSMLAERDVPALPEGEAE
jgi:DNA recombination protein RmuC